MAGEKGATYLDKLCHRFYDEPKGCGKKTDYVCRRCGGPLETYYCEERLYLVKCVDCGTLALVKATSPEAAAGVTLARPTLTPPNEPLTLEELSLFNAPVWIKRIDDEDLSGDGWAIVEGPRCLTWHNRIPVSWEIRVWWPGSEVEDFPKYENYSKTWLAYRRPPEGEEDT